jgi:hypothetical protein
LAAQRSCAPRSTTPARPDTYPCPPYPTQTGAKEKGTLGNTYDFGAGPTACDAVYRIDAVAPHSDNKVSFQFAAFYNDRTLENNTAGNARTL